MFLSWYKSNPTEKKSDVALQPPCDLTLWRHRGVIDEHVTDKKAAKKHFHVPATLLEVLSAIRRHCRDMEALFSCFHISDVGRGVVGGCRGRWFGRLVVSWACGASEVSVVARVHENEKKPCKRWFTGLIVVHRCSYTSLESLLPVCSPSRVVRRCGVSHHEIQTKKTKNREIGGSQTPHIVARVNICRLDRKICR